MMGRLRFETLFGVLLVLSLALTVSTGASELVNKDGDDIAIRGYDPVAYFTEGRPVAGSPQFEHVWHGATWRFASAAHRDLFAGDPRHYAPRYGGFCAGAMAKGMKAPVDPNAWVIIDGKLYLNFAKRYKDEFVSDASGNIAKADVNWARLGHAE